MPRTFHRTFDRAYLTLTCTLGLSLNLALLPCTAALAGPLDEAKARAHLDAVAAGDLDTLMRDYPDDAYVDWVGGPLEGRYRGKADIRVMWQKFIDVNKGKPRPVTLGKVKSFANQKGTSYEAGAEYGGVLPMKVWHVLVYRDGELTTAARPRWPT